MKCELETICRAHQTALDAASASLELRADSFTQRLEQMRISVDSAAVRVRERLFRGGEHVDERWRKLQRMEDAFTKQKVRCIPQRPIVMLRLLD